MASGQNGGSDIASKSAHPPYLITRGGRRRGEIPNNAKESHDELQRQSPGCQLSQELRSTNDLGNCVSIGSSPQSKVLSVRVGDSLEVTHMAVTRNTVDGRNPFRTTEETLE